MKSVFLFLFLISYSQIIWAETICDTIFRSSNVGCSDLSSSHSSGGSFPLLFDAFNFSPSALPTIPTPAGVEAFYNDNKVNVSFLKGINRAGIGATVKSTDTTYFSGVDNYKVALKNESPKAFQASSFDQYYNLGSALDFLRIESLFSLPFGLSYRMNPKKKAYSLQPGIELRTSFLTFSASSYKEEPKEYYDGYYNVREKKKNITMNADMRLGYLILNYALIKEHNETGNYLNNAQVYATDVTLTTSIFSGTFVYQMISLTGAYRSQKRSGTDATLMANSGLSNYNNSHLLLGAAYKTTHIEAGAFYNYVLNNDISGVLKIFF